MRLIASESIKCGDSFLSLKLRKDLLRTAVLEIGSDHVQ